MVLVGPASAATEEFGAFRFVRISGKLYATYVVGKQGAQELFNDGRGAALIRRAGERNGAPVYLIQIK